MKKQILALIACLMLVMSTTAQAVTLRVPVASPSLSFSGTTARGSAICQADGNNDRINAKLRLNRTIPLTTAAEHEKWTTIALLKQEMAKQGKNSQTYKTAITMEALRQFVSNRMENNTLFLSCVGNLENDQLKTILSSDCEKAKTENEVLSAFLKEMQECDNVQLLWNEYWNNIIQQTPPSYYE